MKKMRSLSDIALEIQANWTKPYYGAVPHIDAMLELDSITDSFGFGETGKDVIMYFLSNATTWDGEDAQRIKAELKAMLK